jgi:hypothetical protein
VAARVGQAVASLEYKIEQLQSRRDCTEWVQNLQRIINAHDTLFKESEEWVKSVNRDVERLTQQLGKKTLSHHSQKSGKT